MGTTKTPTRLVFLGIGGSTGKTTAATGLACVLAKRGKEIRYHDGDDQGDGSRLMRYEDAPLVLSDVLGEEAVVDDPSAPQGKRAPSLREIEQPLLRETDEEAEEIGGFGPGYADGSAIEWMSRITVMPSGIGSTGSNLAEAIKKMDQLPAGIGAKKVMAAYESLDADLPDDQIPDLEIMDLSGFKTTMTYLGMEWASRGGNMHGKSGVILVATPDEKGMGKHLNNAFNLVEEVATFYPGVEVRALIPIRTRNKNQGAFYDQMLTALRTNDARGHLVTPPIREAVFAAEAFRKAEPLLTYAPDEGVTADQEAVIDWMVEQGAVKI
ncbi:nucleotide-binding protein [Nocardia sp. NPDC003963]